MDPHDPRMELDLLDNLALAALGEPIGADLQRHAQSCPRCQRELAGLRQTVSLAREAGHPRDQASQPAGSVWDGIASELGIAEPGPTPIRSVRHRRPRSMPFRALLVAAAAAAVLAGAIRLGYGLGRHTTEASAQASAVAQLNAYPGGPAHVSGSATVHVSAAGTELSVTTKGLPLRQGYYEVWMFDPSTNEMVAVGTLPASGAATFPMPPGLDPNAYHVVDVSAQDYNGNPAHRQSVLRGPLTN